MTMAWNTQGAGAGVAQGAATGTAIMPGIGTAIGAGVGLLAGGLMGGGGDSNTAARRSMTQSWRLWLQHYNEARKRLEGSSGNALINRLEREAMKGLQRGNKLSPEQIRQSQQASRAGLEARGLNFSGQGIGQEALDQFLAGQSLYQQRFSNAQNVAQMGQSELSQMMGGATSPTDYLNQSNYFDQQNRAGQAGMWGAFGQLGGMAGDWANQNRQAGYQKDILAAIARMAPGGAGGGAPGGGGWQDPSTYGMGAQDPLDFSGQL